MNLADRFEALVPRLETGRLVLRGLRPDDFAPFAAYQASARSRFTGGPLDRALAWRAFCHLTGHWVHRGYGFFVIEDRASGAALGTCGPYFPEGWPEPEIGWTIWDAAAEGKGLAHEAALAARGFAYDVLGWPTAISLILDGNRRSEALARRLGCTRDGSFTYAQFGATSIWRPPGTGQPGRGRDGGLCMSTPPFSRPITARSAR